MTPTKTPKYDEGAVNPIPLNPKPGFHPGQKLLGFGAGLPVVQPKFGFHLFGNIP
jgi:hypothetical protein